MCGIVGYLDKRGGERPVGAVLLAMLKALGCRGPDSVGVAFFKPFQPFWVVRVALSENYPWAAAEAKSALAQLTDNGHVGRHTFDGAYVRLEIKASWSRAKDVENWVEKNLPGAEVVSLGRHLEIIKQVGSPLQLEETYAISALVGTHAIGHTRLSTESKVDLSHSQPFWAHGVPDLATVHNGHITNYHKLRRQYEQKGHRFWTENDSEIIGVYLRDRMAAGLALEDALRSSLDDFDGSFSYLAASGDTLAYVKDGFGLKPLIVAETDDFVAIATEEIALRQALGRDFVAREPAPGTMKLWTVPQGIRAST